MSEETDYDEANKKTEKTLRNMDKGIIGGVSILMVLCVCSIFMAFFGGIYGFLQMIGVV